MQLKLKKTVETLLNVCLPNFRSIISYIFLHKKVHVLVVVLFKLKVLGAHVTLEGLGKL